MLKIIIITEGGKGIGFGHVTRCLSLYQAFKEKGVNPEFLIKGDDTVSGLLAETTCRLLDWHQNKVALADTLTDADICITDSYLADLSVYKTISNLVKVSVYIDDNKRLDYPRGVVLNWAINAGSLNYPEREEITYLLGSTYASLRNSFRDVPEKKIKKWIDSVVVTFGGIDRNGLTSMVLQMLVKEFPKMKKNVVIGKGFSATARIETVADNKTFIYFSPNANKIRDIMLESDIAISSGGQTLFEFARVGVPVIAVSAADNQNENINGWAATGFVANAGNPNDEDLLKKIITYIHDLKNVETRKVRSKIGRKLIDGFGSYRVAKELLVKYFQNNIILRAAELKDIKSIYNLSNDPFVRRNSFNQENIVYEEHRCWFVKKLNDLEQIFLVAEKEGQFLGQVRLDIAGNMATINISVVNGYRRLGVGRVLSQKVFSYLLQNNSNVSHVRAYVKQENISSIKFFEGLRFKLQKKLIIKDQNALEYILKLKADFEN